jgi:hypothetical protein
VIAHDRWAVLRVLKQNQIGDRYWTARSSGTSRERPTSTDAGEQHGIRVALANTQLGATDRDGESASEQHS